MYTLCVQLYMRAIVVVQLYLRDIILQLYSCSRVGVWSKSCVDRIIRQTIQLTGGSWDPGYSRSREAYSEPLWLCASTLRCRVWTLLAGPGCRECRASLQLCGEHTSYGTTMYPLATS